MNRIPAKIKLAFSLVVPALLLLPGCAGPSHTVAAPYLPPAYYDCSAIDLTSLQNMFYFYLGTVPDIQYSLQDKVLVVKDVKLTQNEIKQASDEYIVVDSLAERARLMAGLLMTLGA